METAEIEDKSLARTRQFAWTAIMIGCVGISIVLVNAFFSFAVTGAKGALGAIHNSGIGKATEIFHGKSAAKPGADGPVGTPMRGVTSESSSSVQVDLPGSSGDVFAKAVPGATPPMKSSGSTSQEREEALVAANIPEAPAAFERLVNEMLVSRPAEFRPGSSILSWNGKTNLDQIIPLLKARPDWRFEIGAHVPASDTADADRITTVRRAETVAGYLGTEGVSNIRLSTRGYGSSRPIADNVSEIGRMKNQRIEIRVLGTQ